MGRVAEVIGLVVESTGPGRRGGGAVPDRRPTAASACWPRWSGFRDGRTLLMPLGELTGIRPGDRGRRRRPRAAGAGRRRRCSAACWTASATRSTAASRSTPAAATSSAGRSTPTPPSPLLRRPIDQRLPLGVRALDALVPCGRGQRLGIFAGSGVGKSTLLGMIARNTEADVNVIGLVGERGREVREFVERDLGPEGLKRSRAVRRHLRPARPGARQVRRDGDDASPRRSATRARTCCC